MTATGFELSGAATPLPALLRSLWRSRALTSMLVRKDFVARYRRTWLGLLWALGLPIVQAVVLTVVFTRVGNFSHAVSRSQGRTVSYAVFVYGGIIAWTYFSATTTAAATALVDNVSLASKIYFPRLVLPIVVVVTGLFPLGVGVVLLLALQLLLGHSVGVGFLWVLPAVALAVGITGGLGLTLSAMHVYFRDVRYIVQAAMTAAFYATPVIYSLSSAPFALRTVLTYGPMAGPVELMRLATVGADPTWPRAVAGGVGWLLVTTALGLALQSRSDRVFVDRL